MDSHGIAFDLGTGALLGILGTTEVVGDLSAYNSTQDVFSYLGESSDDAPILVSLSIAPTSVAPTPEPAASSSSAPDFSASPVLFAAA